MLFQVHVKLYCFLHIPLFFAVYSLQINILCCLSEQRELSVINGFLQSRLPPMTLKCFTRFITFELRRLGKLDDCDPVVELN